MILTPGDGKDQITPGLGNDTINLAELVGATDTLNYSIDDGSSNVDIVSNFDVRIANDIISLDVSATQNQSLMEMHPHNCGSSRYNTSP